MKENIEDYRKNGFINLDEYLLNNPTGLIYPYYIDGYGKNNFWLKVGKENDEKYVYVKPRGKDYINNEYNVYTELITEELMRQVGIKNANFDLAKYDGKYATISDNTLKDYSYNEFIINGEELLDTRMFKSNYGFENVDYDLDDIINTIHEYCISENIDENMENECIRQIKKSCIADIFTLATDRKVSDFDYIVGVNDNGEEIIQLAPLCHNTYSLGSCFSEDEMYEMLDDNDLLTDRVYGCSFDAGTPEDKRDYSYPYWQDTLYYLIDSDEEMYQFARKCASKMDIETAIERVENKMSSRMPSEYKEFAKTVWSSRLHDICECINLNYNKVMADKCYIRDMEER